MSAETPKEEIVRIMHSIAQESIQGILNGKSYQEDSVEQWSTEIISEILTKLKEKQTPKFKFISTVMILSRNSKCINEFQMAIWDSSQDTTITTKWANETMQCIVSVWAFRTRLG